MQAEQERDRASGTDPAVLYRSQAENLVGLAWLCARLRSDAIVASSKGAGNARSRRKTGSVPSPQQEQQSTLQSLSCGDCSDAHFRPNPGRQAISTLDPPHLTNAPTILLPFLTLLPGQPPHTTILPSSQGDVASLTLPPSSPLATTAFFFAPPPSLAANSVLPCRQIDLPATIPKHRTPALASAQTASPQSYLILPSSRSRPTRFRSPTPSRHRRLESATRLHSAALFST
ncbi:hypothetical protein PaG_00705 [Moesziomyces aphidis]|uniref:Uncharacterized protein n=1 Tax=Moesziomyces aphidis TaxID=84754 RepID=W3VT23_MOEAP|nr:hypothetical protein PaG_00705 [Moesziomyces aphidis]